MQEHQQEQPADVISVGGKFAPPPPSNTGGSAVATGGSGPATGGALSGTTGGTIASGTGGTTNTGGATNTGGMAGALGTTGGALATGGASGTTGGAPATGGTATATGGTATGGSSGVMVDINGTLLPKEDVIAFVHLGHSNMAGRSSSPSASRPYHFTEMNLRAWIYRAGNWTPALEPNTAGDADAKARSGYGGPGTALLKEAVALAPTRYFVSLGFGVGSAYCTQFLPGSLYYDSVMAAPKALKGKVTFGAIVIMLGITERHGTAADISGYSGCINKLVTAIRTDLGEPNLPLLINEYEMGSTGAELSPTGTFAKQIIPEIQKIPSVVSNSALVATDSIPMQDDHHFNLDGQKMWAQRVLAMMKTKGWFKW